jgi:hypothetical protein
MGTRMTPIRRMVTDKSVLIRLIGVIRVPITNLNPERAMKDNSGYNF